jgi:hypothetical protein
MLKASIDLLLHWLALFKHKMVCFCWCQPSSVPDSRWSIWPLSTQFQHSPFLFYHQMMILELLACLSCCVSLLLSCSRWINSFQSLAIWFDLYTGRRTVFVIIACLLPIGSLILQLLQLPATNLYKPSWNCNNKLVRKLHMFRTKKQQKYNVLQELLPATEWSYPC